MKKIIALTSIASLLFVFTSVTTVFAGETENNLQMTVEMDETHYENDDTIHVAITLVNNDSETLSLQNGNSCYFQMEVTETEPDDDGEYEILLTQDQECSEAETSIELSPGGTKVFSSYLGYTNMEDGEYRLLVYTNAAAVDQVYGTTTYLEDYETTITIGDVEDEDESNDIEMTVELSQTEYLPGDTITVTVTLENKDDEDFLLTFGDSCYFESRLEDEEGNILAVSDELCAQAVVEEILEMGETNTFVSTINYYYSDVEAGEYQVTIEDGPSIEGATSENKSNVENTVMSITFYEEDTATTEFNDTAGHWAESYIEELIEREVVQGYDDGTFRPDQSVTRAEFLKIFLETTFGDVLEDDKVESPFMDVQEGDWYHDYVCIALEKELVSGYGDYFNPDQEITRAEAMSILVRSYFIGMDELELAEHLADYSESPFSDVTEEWQIPYVAFAYEVMEIVQGYKNEEGELIGEFGPNDSLTRAEASKIVIESAEIGDIGE